MDYYAYVVGPEIFDAAMSNSIARQPSSAATLSGFGTKPLT